MNNIENLKDDLDKFNREMYIVISRNDQTYNKDLLPLFASMLFDHIRRVWNKDEEALEDILFILRNAFDKYKISAELKKDE